VDAADAAVVAAAAREHRVDQRRGYVVAVGAAAGALAGFVGAVDVLRRRG